jgi:hypothetical protein
MVMSLIAFGPLHGSPPSLGTALLAIGAGTVGFLNIVLHVVVRKRRDFSWPMLLFHCVVLLFFIVLGFIQLFKVW